MAGRSRSVWFTLIRDARRASGFVPTAVGCCAGPVVCAAVVSGGPGFAGMAFSKCRYPWCPGPSRPSRSILGPSCRALGAPEPGATGPGRSSALRAVPGRAWACRTGPGRSLAPCAVPWRADDRRTGAGRAHPPSDCAGYTGARCAAGGRSSTRRRLAGAYRCRSFPWSRDGGAEPAVRRIAGRGRVRAARVGLASRSPASAAVAGGFAPQGRAGPPCRWCRQPWSREGSYRQGPRAHSYRQGPRPVRTSGRGRVRAARVGRDRGRVGTARAGVALADAGDLAPGWAARHPCSRRAQAPAGSG